ncbi:hypothetical protein [Patulibacter sp. SYSU D01012]|uniref:hypothetical protein n=1 Tax=Patulibacter sp. SYSU D01012 TaxID=2817381 RepID=UPI001B3108F4|nr:hypothetical protein [Patulibacter sp. SYSU D01012]
MSTSTTSGRGDAGTAAGRSGSRPVRLSTETKHAFKTTEFVAMVVVIVGILVSALVVKGGDSGDDEFIARQAWLYVSIVAGAYFISRGLAKSGSREPYWADGTNSDRGDDHR